MTHDKQPRFAGMGGHHSARAGSVEWLTPPSIIAALGPFDLDPCAPERQPYPTASRTFTRSLNGLIQPWDGRIWLNPPYSHGVIGLWLARMSAHDRGTALIFARTETEAFHRHVWAAASALLFMRGRINFHLPNGDRVEGNAGAPTVLCAYGADDADVLAACEIDGKFVPLRVPRSVLVSLFPASNEDEKINVTWARLVDQFFDGRDQASVDEMFFRLRSHPKGARNRNVRAKLRQQLQRGPYERVERGVYRRTT